MNVSAILRGVQSLTAAIKQAAVDAVGSHPACSVLQHIAQACLVNAN